MFEGVVGGSLEHLVSRLSTMTESDRHPKLVELFGRLAKDLISGIQFIHASGMVHADIKPANVLLDLYDSRTNESPGIRARYIDFSASFESSESELAAANAGGTWAFMAPEQLRLQKDLNTPTFASDVWSVGISLLFVIVGSSPYAAACGRETDSSYLFRLREAIKNGQPISYAKMDPVIEKRFASCQSFLDCCNKVLKKDRADRWSAEKWLKWLLEDSDIDCSR